MKDLVDELQAILDKATTSDSSAARALTALAAQADHGFSSARYGDRDSAVGALQKATHAAALAGDAKKLTPERLAELNPILAHHKNDELFAAEFATKLGAENTLRFWTDMCTLHSGERGSGLHELQELQKNPSTALATATLSDSDGMTAWKQQVLNDTSKAYTSENPAYPVRGPMNATGFHVMSSLMGHGKYDTEFLEAYGKKLLASDKAQANASGMDSDHMWTAPDQLTDLVFGKEDGQDPVVGFMKALSHNPEAATQTFADKDVLEHSLESIRYTARDAEVARALEAAVTGVPDGGVPTEPARPHSKTQVEIVRNIMHMIANPEGGARLVTGETGGSFGDMASSYMAEISNELAGHGAESIFRTSSADPHGLERTDVQRFLYEVARDPQGRASIILGESIYTSSVLEAHTADPSLYSGDRRTLVETIGQNVGPIEGIVGHSVADAHIQGELKSEEDENNALKRKGDFIKAVIGAGVSVGSVALVPMGPLHTAVGATAIRRHQRLHHLRGGGKRRLLRRHLAPALRTPAQRRPWRCPQETCTPSPHRGSPPCTCPALCRRRRGKRPRRTPCQRRPAPSGPPVPRATNCGRSSSTSPTSWPGTPTGWVSARSPGAFPSRCPGSPRGGSWTSRSADTGRPRERPAPYGAGRSFG
ncbi:hypothetical protein LUW75_19020 [Streptomyces sp. MRC013]|uniref:hypothetical protein n=1 Tax=Streptomyces sp. MRC013 TaxID=2898276 RepID=UPI002026140E|nr:hypothetical protein [Streptomyces sp. MRC013]URM92855.1 hypothetical protein LUW75_19020 [Streptomyces sp. MRC013]